MCKMTPIENSILRILKKEKRFLSMREIANGIKYTATDKYKLWLPQPLRHLIAKGYVECCQLRSGLRYAAVGEVYTYERKMFAA